MIVRKMHTGGYQELVAGKEETEGGAIDAPCGLPTEG